MAKSEICPGYFTAIAATPVLTAEQEVGLFRRLQGGDTSIRDRIVLANQGLVIEAAKTYHKRGLSFGELISEGNIGLMRAIEKFDLEKKCRFATYALYWIAQAMTRAIQEKSHLVRPPVDLVGQMHTYRRTVSKLHERLGRRPHSKEVASALSVGEDRVQRFEKAETALFGVRRFADFEFNDPAPIGRIHDESWRETERDLQARDTLDRLLGCVSEREREVLRLRYGLSGDTPRTLREVGEQFRVTKARVGQIEHNAMAKMRREVVADPETSVL